MLPDSANTATMRGEGFNTRGDKIRPMWSVCRGCTSKSSEPNALTFTGQWLKAKATRGATNPLSSIGKIIANG